MKINILAVIAVASLLAAGTTFAQNGPGNGPRGQGKGYGGPPQSNEERAARHQSRVKAQQEQLERLRETLQQALGSIETPSDAEDLDIDELAEA